MKNTRLIALCICLIFISATAFAVGLSVLELDEGENTISLSIVNTLNNDLADMTVEVDRDKLPSWMTFRGTPQAVIVVSGSEGHEKLFLNLGFSCAFIKARTQVLFTFIIF